MSKGREGEGEEEGSRALESSERGEWRQGRNKEIRMMCLYRKVLKRMYSPSSKNKSKAKQEYHAHAASR